MDKIEAIDFEKTLAKNSLVGVLFVSKAVEQCSQISDLVIDLSKQENYSKIKFVSIDVSDESTAPLSSEFSVNSVPTLVLFLNTNEMDRVVGVDTAKLVAKVDKLIESNNTLEQRLKTLINQEPIMIFMKGTPEQPRCGFSRTLVSILADVGVKYGHFNILEDEEVRQGLKSYSKWPTYPQVYSQGKLMGGLDIIKDFHENGELAEMLKA